MEFGLFFGAGAEVGYGLPSGGKFAIDLFRQDPTPYKQQLREKLHKINSRSTYANYWLPKDYDSRSIFAFGKNEFTSLIESSIQYKKLEIIAKINNFDSEFQYACTQLDINISNLRQKFSDVIQDEIGNILFDQDIKINEKLTKDVKLFGSDFYSAGLEIIRTQKNCDDLRRYVIAFLQLIIGAYGQDFVQNLNEELFESAPDDIPIFDDIFGMFRLEFDRAGSTALDLLLNEKRQFNTSDEATLIDLFCAINQKMLENIFSCVLDYQKLIDDHFRYLFSPKTEWAKFTKMVIFLEIAHDYILKQIPENLGSEGYYHDISELLKQGHTINVVGTSNYNNLFQSVSNELSYPKMKIYHLNGSTKDFYNPYKNEVIEDLLLNLSYTNLSAKDAKGDKLLNRPTNKFNFGVDYYGLKDFHFNVNGEYIGSRESVNYLSSTQKTKTGNYTIWNAVVDYDISKNFSTYLKLDNIFNKDYQIVDGYATSQRAAFVGLKASF